MNDNFQIPILTYHSLHAPGWEYQSNDHVALEQDLALIKKLGFQVVSLTEIVQMLIKKQAWPNKPSVAISFDDGTDHDFFDFSHPDYGYLKSFYNLLKQAVGGGFKPVATSFVIASDAARTVLDKVCIAGRDQWRDVWWKEAAESGLLDIANHSWDHTHECLAEVIQADQIKGRFDQISDFDSADLQIKKAEHFLAEKIGSYRTGLFAYPYGHHNEFLTNEYFEHNKSLFKGAFITGGEYVHAETNRWKIPRFVCGEHWHSPEELVRILDAVSL